MASVVTLLKMQTPISPVKALDRSKLKDILQKNWLELFKLVAITEEQEHRRCLRQTEGKKMDSKMQCGVYRQVLELRKGHQRKAGAIQAPAEEQECVAALPSQSCRQPWFYAVQYEERLS